LSNKHQKYNDYLKELCELAKMKGIVKVSMLERVSTSKSKTRNDHRTIEGDFKK
tara:strand:- start:67 stop:228 length:162 start_codon:yes stop_codon:yes gene_type:complete